MCIDSDWSTFYLLHLDVSWAEVYETEPLANITDPAQRALVLGAEVCKWGEETDASTFDGYVWPRLAAAAETFCACAHYNAVQPAADFLLFGRNFNRKWYQKCGHILCNWQRNRLTPWPD